MTAAITTRLHGPTNFKSARVKATARKASDQFPAIALTQQYEHRLSAACNHADAAKRLAESLDWSGVWVAGGLPDERGNVYVLLPGSYSRAWVDKYIPGREGDDWFFVERRK